MDPLLLAGLIVGFTFVLLSLFLFGVTQVLQALDYDVYDG